MRMVEVVELRDGLRAVAALPLPVKIAYRLAKVIERVEVEGKRFDGLRQKLFEKHGERDGSGLRVPAQAREAFEAELNDLLLLDTELVVEPVISVEDLGDAKIAAADLVRCRAILAPEQQGNESRGER